MLQDSTDVDVVMLIWITQGHFIQNRKESLLFYLNLANRKYNGLDVILLCCLGSTLVVFNICLCIFTGIVGRSCH